MAQPNLSRDKAKKAIRIVHRIYRSIRCKSSDQTRRANKAKIAVNKTATTRPRLNQKYTELLYLGA
jgi:hypothetical protein